eukprot:10572366-Alexandrium_andersonii.AAC.1
MSWASWWRGTIATHQGPLRPSATSPPSPRAPRTRTATRTSAKAVSASVCVCTYTGNGIDETG